METIGKITSFFITVIVGAILSGFVLMKFWAWFIVPIFSLPTLTVVQAIGLGFIIRWLTHEKEVDEDKDFVEILIMSLKGIVSLGVAFFMGWIIHLFL